MLPVGISQHEVSGPEGLQTPVLFVEQVVVVPAQEYEVVEVGVAVVGPVDAVVGVAATGWDRTAGDATAVVTDGEQVELGVGHAAGLAAVVDDHTTGPGDQSVDAGVASHPPDRLGGERDGPGVRVEHPAQRGSDQVGDVDRGDQLRSVAFRTGGGFQVGEDLFGHRHQRVSATLLRSAFVVVGASRQDPDGFADEFHALGVEEPVEAAHPVEQLRQMQLA